MSQTTEVTDHQPAKEPPAPPITPPAAKPLAIEAAVADLTSSQLSNVATATTRAEILRRAEGIAAEPATASVPDVKAPETPIKEVS
ncbi:MAG: hypothetical protein ACHQTE_01405, partial [Candidatus Saccharimonadales bacterium]